MMEAGLGPNSQMRTAGVSAARSRVRAWRSAEEGKRERGNEP